MATDKRPTMLRLPEDLYEKLRLLAFIERRSVNRQIEHVLEKYIADFEAANGPLEVPAIPSQSP